MGLELLKYLPILWEPREQLGK